MYHIFKSKISIIFAVIFFLSNPVKAQQLPMDRILDQKKLEEQQEKLLEKPEILEPKEITKDNKRNSQNCIEVKKITFEGVTLISKKNQKKLSTKFVNKCIFNDQIGELLNDVTNYYIKQGYTNARTYFKGFDPKSGTINLLILEGKINRIILNNLKNEEHKDQSKVDEEGQLKTENSFLEEAQIFFAFPTGKNKIFDIADFEQGINQMNRLRSNNAVIDVRPSNTDGTSDIIINNYQNPNSLEIGLNYDNSGSKSTGVYNTTYSINKDNLLYLNDNVGFSQIKSDRSETNMFNISIPFGYYTLSYADSSNKYSSVLSGKRIEGTSDSHNLSLERLILRSKKQEINLNASLNLRNQTRKDTGILVIPSQRLSTGRIGTDYKINLKNNLTIYSGFTYSKGLELHNAIDDAAVLNKDIPRAQFEKFSYNFNLYQPSKYLNYSLQANIQHSSDALYSSEIIYVGGSKYTVRGVQFEGINGSKGGYFRNDFNVNLGQVLASKNLKTSKENSKILNQTLNILNATQPYFFYDYGYAKEIPAAFTEAKTEYISGAGAGLKYFGKYLNGEVTYASTINAPNYVIKSNDYQNSSVYFGVGGKYWF